MTLEKFKQNVTDHIGELTEEKLMKHVCNYNNSRGIFKVLVENGHVILLSPVGNIMKVEKSVDNILAVMITIMNSSHGVRWEM